MKEKLQELYNLKRYIESKEFQEYLMKPLYAEIDSLKYAYDCESLKELSNLKGKRQGLQFFVRLLKGIDNEIKNLKYELEQAEGK